MTKISSPPKYRHQKSRNLAVVRIHGIDYYLGEYGSPASRQLYARLIAEKWADSPETDTAYRPVTQKTWPTIDELIARFMTKHVPRTYVDKDENGNPMTDFTKKQEWFQRQERVKWCELSVAEVEKLGKELYGTDGFAKLKEEVNSARVNGR
ncbi:MAG: hypothetical protein FWC43_13865 [Planctomycetaceae bacterium]|nr:hypothetical protein [Planctomycetaceae bacterium]